MVHLLKRKVVRFILCAVVIGIIVGYLSYISDNIPSYVQQGHSFLAYIAIMANSLPIWFLIAVLIGNMFGKTTRQSAIYGAIYTVIAITFYFVFSHILNEVPSELNASFSDMFLSYVVWYIASVVGGLLGGAIGGIIKHSPLILLVVIPGLILQLFLNGKDSWNDSVGIAQNITFCALVFFTIIFVIWKNKNKKEGRPIVNSH